MLTSSFHLIHKSGVLAFMSLMDRSLLRSLDERSLAEGRSMLLQMRQQRSLANAAKGWPGGYVDIMKGTSGVREYFLMETIT